MISIATTFDDRIVEKKRGFHTEPPNISCYRQCWNVPAMTMLLWASAASYGNVHIIVYCYAIVMLVTSQSE